MAKDIEQYVAKCAICLLHRHLKPREAMITIDINANQWQKVASDIFSLYGHDYLLVVDNVIIQMKSHILASWHTGYTGS